MSKVANYGLIILTLVIKDKSAMKLSFKKLRVNLSFSLFTKGTAYSSLRQSGERVEMHLGQMDMQYVKGD